MKQTKLQKQISEMNQAFKKASKAQKRVMIAQDVIAQIKAKRYVPESGTFVIANWSEKIDYKDHSDNIQEAFQKKQIETCQVCALGGLFMSCTNLNNNTNFEQLEQAEDLGEMIDNEERISNGMDKFFSVNQLKLIETYFENAQGYFRDYEVSINIPESHRNAFHNQYLDDDERMIAIMENIVNNKGTFIPKKLKVLNNY